MKLYQLQKDTRFILTGNDWGVGEEFTFDRVEGLYARCFRPLPSGIDEIYHLRVDADVEPVKGIDLKYGEPVSFGVPDEVYATAAKKLSDYIDKEALK
jgi:hypothetical protein